MAAYKFTVTPELIDRATQRDSRHCMIAEAIKATRPDWQNIIVDLATIRWTNPRTGKRYICLTPEICGERLVDFDRGNPVEPFTFNIEPVQVTPVVRREATETRAEARAAGRKHPRQRRLPVGEGNESRAKTGITGAQHGKPLIHGGEPLRAGHLSNRPDYRSHEAALIDQHTVDELAGKPEGSNVKLSGARFRMYGRRLLKP